MNYSDNREYFIEFCSVIIVLYGVLLIYSFDWNLISYSIQNTLICVGGIYDFYCFRWSFHPVTGGLIIIAISGLFSSLKKNMN